MAFMEDQLNRLGLRFVRIEAVTADEALSAKDDEYWSTWERPLGAPERACFLSHLSIWKRLALQSSGEPVLVLEDDALLSERLPDVLRAARLLQGIDHASLEVRCRRKLLDRSARHLAPGMSLVRLYQDRSGAAAYLLWPSGARKLVHSATRTAGLADAVICRTRNLLSYQVEPACAVQLDCCPDYGLTRPMETRSATRIEAHAAVRRHTLGFRYRRLRSQIRMGSTALRHAHHSVRRTVQLHPEDFRKTYHG